MKINLWYSKSMGQWRWTLTDEKDTKWMEAGQRPVLRDAMEDVKIAIVGAGNADVLLLFIYKHLKIDHQIATI